MLRSAAASGCDDGDGGGYGIGRDFEVALGFHAQVFHPFEK